MENIKLPVDHRLHSYIRVGLVILFIGTLALAVNNGETFFIVVGSIVLSFGLHHICEHNIQSATLSGKLIRIKHNWRIIEVPVKSITSIKHALGGMSFSLGYSYIYIIRFEDKYAFGTDLELRYKHDFQVKNEHEPTAIKTIRAIMKSDI